MYVTYAVYKFMSQNLINLMNAKKHNAPIVSGKWMKIAQQIFTSSIVGHNVEKRLTQKHLTRNVSDQSPIL